MYKIVFGFGKLPASLHFFGRNPGQAMVLASMLTLTFRLNVRTRTVPRVRPHVEGAV